MCNVTNYKGDVLELAECFQCEGRGGYDLSFFGGPDWVNCPVCHKTGYVARVVQPQEVKYVARDGKPRDAKVWRAGDTSQ